MFDIITTRSKVIGAVSIIGIVATAVSIAKDYRDATELEECLEEMAAEVVDPTAGI